MLRVLARVGPSPIHGLGLFALEPIEAGTVLWAWSPGWDLELTVDAVDAAAPALRDWVSTYGWREGGVWHVPADDTRFMNHSTTPNCDPTAPEGTVALRRIEAGEEIVEDYSTFDPDFESYSAGLRP